MRPAVASGVFDARIGADASVEYQRSTGRDCGDAGCPVNDGTAGPCADGDEP
jgi:hypothetical protein